MAKAIKLQNDTYFDSSSIVHEKELLSDILNSQYGKVLLIGKGSNKTITLECTSDIAVLFTHHHSHGSCGGLYVFFRGAGTGNKMATLINSSHATVSYEDETITLTVDTWGTHYMLVHLK